MAAIRLFLPAGGGGNGPGAPPAGAAERRLEELSQRLANADNARDPEGLRALNAEYAAADTLLCELYDEWERVSQELMSTRGD